MRNKKRWLAVLLCCSMMFTCSNTSNLVALAADSSEVNSTVNNDDSDSTQNSIQNSDADGQGITDDTDAQDQSNTKEESADSAQDTGNGDGQEDDSDTDTEAVAAKEDLVVKKASASSTTFNGLTVAADDGEDLTYGNSASYEIYYSGAILYINTNRPVTISGSTTTAALAIAQGVHANVTFKGVTITYAAAPCVDMMPNTGATTDAQRTQLNLTLADGSKNSLNATGAAYAAIHVSYGSIFTIDDGVTNWGEVYGGRIVGDEDEDGIEKPSWMMDSSNPGSLTAIGGTNGSCIGGNNNENSGRIIINGGTITVNSYTNGTKDSSGAGIGGGNQGGAGCLLDGGGIIINGGTINATASYHGAGIGTGWNCKTAGVGHNGRVTGDITVNGGYVTTKGMGHGNAMGGGCNAQNINNVGHGAASTAHQIKITGGTIIPNRNSTESWTYQLGAAGGEVIVLGGSFSLNTRSGTDSGYDITGASVQSSDGSTLTLVKIQIGAMEGVEVGDRIYDLTVTVDGKPLDVAYGLANLVTSDKTLYFWLPKSSIGKSVNISNVTLIKANGTKLKALYPFSLPEISATGDNVTKRWVTFDVDTTKFSDELNALLYKRYDGLGWDMEILAKAIVDQNIEVPEPEGAIISDEEELNFSSVRIKDWEGNSTKDSSTSGEISTTGTYTITVDYDKYKNDATFGASYWGHQTTVESIISPADSRIVNLDAQSTWQDDEHTKFKTITLTADVLPQTGEATTCASPDGTVQFYINGVKVGKPVSVEAVGKKTSKSSKSSVSKASASSDTDEENTDDETLDYGDYNYSTATLTIDFTTEQSKYPIPELTDGTFQVKAEYLGGTNYKEAEKSAEITEEDAPDEFPFTAPPTATTDGSTENAIIPDSYETEEGENGDVILHGYASDTMTTPVSSEEQIMTSDDFMTLFEERYQFINHKSGGEVTTEVEEFEILDEDGNKVDRIDTSQPKNYTIVATVYDTSSNFRTTVRLSYNLSRVDIDTDGDGIPDVNVDTDGDGIPDVNIDTDGDNKPDVNIVDQDGDGQPDNIDPNDDTQNKTPNVNVVDTDHDGKPDDLDEYWPDKLDGILPTVSVDTDGDGIPDVNIDKDGDGTPDLNIVDKDGDGKPDAIDPDDTTQDKTPDTNIVDTDGDGQPDDLDSKWLSGMKKVSPTVNIDTDGDGIPDVNVDTDGDGIPDVNIDWDGDGIPDVNIVDKDGDGKPDSVNPKDKDQDKTPDVNVDTDGDGIPDVNIDTNGDGKPDVNIVDKDGDGKPDSVDPKDKDQDKTPDVNIVDTDGDGQPDDLDSKWPSGIKYVTPTVNVDNDGDGIPDTNVDTDEDGKPDVNIDKDGDGVPDLNIVDKDGDGKPDNVNPKDKDQDKTPDVNIVDKDRDGKPDDLDEYWPGKIKKLSPNVNIDSDGDGIPDTNVDTDNDGKADVNIDTDGDGEPDINIVDKDGDGKPDNINIKDPKQNKVPNVNIVDNDGDGIPDDLDKLTAAEIKKLKPNVNVDTDGDGIPDVNIDTDGDGIPDKNIDKDGNGIADDQEADEVQAKKVTTNKISTKNVATGDNTPLALLIIIMVLCAAALIVGFWKKYHTYKNR